jgi:hypothetical protein
MTRLAEAFDFLIRQVEGDSRHAVAAVEALGRIGSSPELRARIEEAVDGTGSERLRDVFQEHFGGRLP